MNKKPILNALYKNMGYVEGESVAIVIHNAPVGRSDDKFEESINVANAMFEAFTQEGIRVKMHKYVIEEFRNGIEPPIEFIQDFPDYDIVFIPSAYSLTHTNYRKMLTAGGARVASMPGFLMSFFDEGGPMDADYDELIRITTDTFEKLSNAKKVVIRGHGTNMEVEVDPDLVLESSGIITDDRGYGNLPGAETFCVPVHDGDSNGYFTVPVGWGGPFGLKYPARFFVEKGRIVDIISKSDEAQEWIDENVKPLVFGQEDFNVLAELGIGTNPNVTAEYMEKMDWNTLLAEKIYGSAHFANGNSHGMGGKNNVPVHIDWVVPNVRINFS